MAFGVTPEGFTIKTLDDIRTSLQQRARSLFGENVDTDEREVLGQLIGVFSGECSEVWEGMGGVYNAFIPGNAVGVNLDNVSAITGTRRDAASNSSVVGTCVGTAGTVLLAGRQVSVADTGVIFASLADATIVAPGAWAGSTIYVLGQRRTNSGKVYQVITPGTSAGAGGPTTTAADITDGTVHWKYLGTGTGVVDADFECAETGPKLALAGTLTVIETPVGGWANVLNLLDADLGADRENDPLLRAKRETELRGAGLAAPDAIRARILQVEGVTSCSVYVNNTLGTVNGLPPKSVEAIVSGGDDDAVRAAVWAATAGGIETYGTNSGITVDSQGVSQTVKFSRPDEIEIYCDIHVFIDPSTFPADGEDQIIASIVEWGEALAQGRDVYAQAAAARAFLVDGVLDLNFCFVEDVASPSAASVPITTRQKARFDTSRVSLATTNGTV